MSTPNRPSRPAGAPVPPKRPAPTEPQERSTAKGSTSQKSQGPSTYSAPAPGSAWARVGAPVDPADLPPRAQEPAKNSSPRPPTPRSVKPTGSTAVPAQPSRQDTATVATKSEAPATREPQRRADPSEPELSALQLALVRTKARFTVPVPSARLAEKRKADRRRFAIVWGRRAGYVLAIAAAAWLVLLSPVFALDTAKVSVSGYGTVVEPTEVRDVVDAMEGRSLALVSVGQIASALKDIPGVREAHVQRSWPNGLIVTLESREPVAAVPTGHGGYTLVDDEGVQVGRADAPPKGLPTLTVPLGEGKARVLASALGVMNAMPADLRDRVQAMTAATEDSVSFVLRKGPTVEWGSADDSELKVHVLQVLLESKQARKADVIDVSAPTLPITKNN